MSRRRTTGSRTARPSKTSAPFLPAPQYESSSPWTSAPCRRGKSDVEIIVLPGDGIGPEITDATLRVLERVKQALSLDLAFHVRAIGLTSLQSAGTTLPPPVLDACRRADGVILGPVSTADYPPREEGGVNVSAELRIQLDLFANVRPSRTRDGVAHWGRTPMDLVIVRENTEGFYADRNMYRGSGEFMPTPDLALSFRKISGLASSRIA